MCGSNTRGYFTIWRHTVRTRMEAKLRDVKQGLRARMHEPVPVVGKWLGEVMRGYFQYHAVPGNQRAMARFGDRIRFYWRLALRRRSQTGRVRVARYTQLFAKWLPKLRVQHPYSADRFDALYSR